MTALTLAFDALVLASLADAVTTRLGLQTGAVVELNPLMHWSTRSLARAVLTKLLGLAVIGAVLLSLVCMHPRLAVGVTWVGALGTGWLAWRNWQIYRIWRRWRPDEDDARVDALRYAFRSTRDAE
jgi:hypothetical protein